MTSLKEQRDEMIPQVWLLKESVVTKLPNGNHP